MRNIWKIAIILASIILLGLFARLFYGNQTDQRPSSGQNLASHKSAQAVLVRQAFVGEAKINDQLKAIGTGRALYSVTLTARNNGILQKIYVRSGDRVKKGAPIAQLDNSKEAIALEQARLAYNDAEDGAKRLQTLRASNTVSAVRVMEAKLAAQNAKLALDAAQLAFNQRKILSPIDGVVGIFNIDRGNYITPNDALVRIDNLDRLLIDLWVPERFVPFIKVGAPITAILVSDPKKSYKGSIVAMDNMVEDRSRTMRVRAMLDNRADNLRAGMSFEVTLNFQGEAYLSIDPLALQWQSGGPYIWKIVDHKAKQVPVTIVQRTASFILIKADLQKGDPIIIEGTQNLSEGRPIKLAKGEALAQKK